MPYHVAFFNATTELMTPPDHFCLQDVPMRNDPNSCQKAPSEVEKPLLRDFGPRMQPILVKAVFGNQNDKLIITISLYYLQFIFLFFTQVKSKLKTAAVFNMMIPLLSNRYLLPKQNIKGNIWSIHHYCHIYIERVRGNHLQSGGTKSTEKYFLILANLI